MEANINILEATEGKVVKQMNPGTTMISVALILLSVIMVFFAGYIQDKASALYMSLMTIGIIGFITGVLMMLLAGKQYRFLPTKSKVTRNTLYLDTLELHPLINCLDTNQYDGIKKMKRAQNSGVKVDIISSADNEFVGVQVYEYVPHSYVQASPLYCVYGEDAKRLYRSINYK